jgi:hypothetical protein
MSFGEYFSTTGPIPIDAVISHISTICGKLTVFDHTVVLEKLMVYTSFAAPFYGSADCVTAEAETPIKI